jgi:hypothetical protein
MLLQIAMLMEYAADVSLAYEGRAVRECLPLVAVPMGIAVIGANMAYLA